MIHNQYCFGGDWGIHKVEKKAQEINSIIVKEGISVRVETSGFKQLMYPNSDYYKSKTYFHNGDSASKYIYDLV